MTFNGLPIYNIDINEDDNTGLQAISLVDRPAVEIDFLCFSEDIKPMNFSINEDEHILTAVALRADFPIYRIGSSGYEYYVTFSKDVIKRLVRKYAKNNLFNSVNINHDSYSFVKDVYMIESFIIDKDKGVDYKGFEGISDGSWVISFYIDNDELWNVVKNTDSLNGVSVEGLFSLVEENFTSQIDPIESLIDEILNESNKLK